MSKQLALGVMKHFPNMAVAVLVERGVCYPFSFKIKEGREPVLTDIPVHIRAAIALNPDSIMCHAFDEIDEVEWSEFHKIKSITNDGIEFTGEGINGRDMTYHLPFNSSDDEVRVNDKPKPLFAEEFQGEIAEDYKVWLSVTGVEL